MRCNLCPNRCNADRARQAGACGAPEGVAAVARASLHFYEEPFLAGKGGSGAVFFSGCTMRCVYCQNAAISRKLCGKFLTPSELSDLFCRLEDAGAENLDLVNPTHFLSVIEGAFRLRKPSVPVIYNTSGYETVESVERASEFVSVWLPDYKYAYSELAASLSSRPDYPDVALRALERMRALSKDVYFKDRLISGMAVRHLVLPGEVRNTLAALERIKEALGTSTILSLMSQYTPMPGLRPPLDRKLFPLEYKIALSRAVRLGFSDIYVQEADSSSQIYIPDWSDSGLL